jgi:hypothetical protein
MGFMADCKVTDLGEFDASPVMVRDDRMGGNLKLVFLFGWLFFYGVWWPWADSSCGFRRIPGPPAVGRGGGDGLGVVHWGYWVRMGWLGGLIRCFQLHCI